MEQENKSSEVMIWRVENEYGSGPYHGRGNVREDMYASFFRLAQASFRRPTIFTDRGLSGMFNRQDYWKMSCGFKDIEEYQWWFRGQDVKLFLEKSGFKLVKYRCPSEFVIQSKRQLVFDKSKATCLERRSCVLPTTRHPVLRLFSR